METERVQGRGAMLKVGNQGPDKRGRHRGGGNNENGFSPSISGGLKGIKKKHTHEESED